MEYFAFQWHITDECDQRCEHCYIFSEGHPHLIEMPLRRAYEVIDRCEAMSRRLNRLPYFFITGGDPLLHRNFRQILERVHERNIPFTIMGNPFHLTDDACRMLKDLGCRKYQVSIDGMRATHDSIRKPGSFDATVEALDRMNRCGLKSAVMTTVSGTNIDEIPDIVDLVVEHKADIFAFGRYCPTSSEKSTHITPAEYRDFLGRMWEKFEEHKDSGTTFSLKDHLWKLFLFEKGLLHVPEDSEPDTIYDGCHCGASHFTILPDGNVMACRRFESTVGNIFKTPLHELWEGAEMEGYRQHEKFEKCRKCELLRFCRGCPAVSFGYHGSFYAPDPQCWKEVD